MEELDPNTVAATVIENLIKNLATSVVGKSSAKFKDLYNSYFDDFNDLLRSTYNNISFVRTLTQRDRATKLTDIYVPLFFSCSGETETDQSVLSHLIQGDNIVIQATGGAGKSVFLKYAWLQFFEEPIGRIPIFIELRRLNDMKDISLETSLYYFVKENKKNLSESNFKSICDEGGFIFLLDGFDEIKFDRMNDIQKRIVEFSTNYKLCPIAVSSRHDDRFNSWSGFTNYSVNPLTLTQVKRIIELVYFDNDSKKAFLKKLDNKFYEEHKFFLSVPLLAIILLITFDSYSEVPGDLHLFYDHAYTALFHYHDSFKDSFTRERRSGLAIDRFKRVFSIFCLFSYFKQKYEFSETEIRDYLNIAVKSSTEDVDIEKLIYDITQSVCLMQKDGLSYVFCHRSFQEYFAAYCVCFVLQEKSKSLLKSIFLRPDDNSLSMAYRMNKNFVQRYFLVPIFKNLPVNNTYKKKTIFEVLDILKVKIIVNTQKKGKSRRIAGMRIEEKYDFNNTMNYISKCMGKELPDLVSLILIPLFDVLVKSHGVDFGIGSTDSQVFTISFTESGANIEPTALVQRKMTKSVNNAIKTIEKSRKFDEMISEYLIFKSSVKKELKQSTSALEDLLA